jgi:hypothetical protein
VVVVLKSGLSLYCHQVTSGGVTGAVREYGQEIQNLNYTTVSPGGSGQLTAMLHVSDARLPRPELSLFAIVAVFAPMLPMVSTAYQQTQCVWIGEITDLDIGFTASDGEYISITALGAGNGLRDHPLSVLYTSQTARQIVSDQLSRLSSWNLPIAQDTSAIFPDNPATLYTMTEQSRHMEEVMSDMAILAGNYDWGTIPHPLASQPSGSAYRDGNQFPLGQVYVRARDTSTTHYQASLALGEVTEYHIQPSAERAYNHIGIGYAVTGTVGTATYDDPRLGGGGAIGSAPFRRRDYTRDLSGTSIIGSTQAQSIANTYGALFQNGMNKTSATLTGARDMYGNPIPVYTIVAGRNIFIPEMSVRGTQLPTGVSANTNQWFIVQTTYSEDASGTVQNQIQCDNFTDDGNVQIARLQLEADAEARAGAKTTGVVQYAGAAELGFCGAEGDVSTAGHFVGGGVNFRSTMTNVPTSITLVTNDHSNDASHVATRIISTGFSIGVSATAAGHVFWFGTYQTNGNCINAVDLANRTFDHHCDNCLNRNLAQPFSDIVVTNGGGVPGQSSMAFICPQCGAMEFWNTNLGPEDEDGEWRGTQAKRIRAIMLLLAVQRRNVALRRGGL